MDKSWVRWRLDAPDITVTKIIIIYCLVYYFFLYVFLSDFKCLVHSVLFLQFELKNIYIYVYVSFLSDIKFLLI